MRPGIPPLPEGANASENYKDHHIVKRSFPDAMAAEFFQAMANWVNLGTMEPVSDFDKGRQAAWFWIYNNYNHERKG